jgi:hypothetical protein
MLLVNARFSYGVPGWSCAHPLCVRQGIPVCEAALARQLRNVLDEAIRPSRVFRKKSSRRRVSLRTATLPNITPGGNQ